MWEKNHKGGTAGGRDLGGRAAGEGKPGGQDQGWEETGMIYRGSGI